MRHIKKYILIISPFCLIIILFGCDSQKKDDHLKAIEVTATAYNSSEAQTKKGNIGLAAWGDTLVPGEKAIAVSRDLIKEGLEHNTKVKIEGLEGEYIVKDKMNKRWTKKIDIYMGLDEKAAKEWGKQKVKIRYDSLSQSKF